MVIANDFYCQVTQKSTYMHAVSIFQKIIVRQHDHLKLMLHTSCYMTANHVISHLYNYIIHLVNISILGK